MERSMSRRPAMAGRHPRRERARRLFRRSGRTTAAKTARISKITRPGLRSTVIDGLPSAISSLPSGDTLGVADVAFFQGALYAVLTGGGCSHGNPDIPNAVIRVDAGR